MCWCEKYIIMLNKQKTKQNKTKQKTQKKKKKKKQKQKKKFYISKLAHAFVFRWTFDLAKFKFLNFFFF